MPTPPLSHFIGSSERRVFSVRGSRSFGLFELVSPRGPTRRASTGDATSRRRHGHSGLRNVPTVHHRYRVRRDCACVRPNLSPDASDVLTERSNYRGRRIQNVGRNSLGDRTLALRVGAGRATGSTNGAGTITRVREACLPADSDVSGSGIPKAAHELHRNVCFRKLSRRPTVRSRGREQGSPQPSVSEYCAMCNESVPGTTFAPSRAAPDIPAY